MNSPLGVRLRDCPSPRFNWRDLAVFVRRSNVYSNLYGELFPDRAGWGRPEMLWAAIADELRWLHWAQTAAAHEGLLPPDPIPRPGYEPHPRREGSKPKKPMPLNDQTKAALAAQAGREAPDEGPEKLKKLNSLFRQAS